MSRIGNQPINILDGVEVDLQVNNFITVKGKKGKLFRKLVPDMNIKIEDSIIYVNRPNNLKRYKALHGLTRTLIYNMIVGVTQGYSKTLEVNGVGYRATKAGNKLVLTLGYSHPVEMIDPEGLDVIVGY